MKQYCRYCANALDYDGILICEADAPCGNNGAGKEYSIEKAKRLNTCKHFYFNPYDLLGQNSDGSFRQYKPHKVHKSKAQQAKEAGQISIGAVMGE
jgi:hypothetical protein